MQHASGTSLQRLLTECCPFTEREAPVSLQAIQVVHSDLKQDKVLTGPEEKSHLTNFALARAEGNMLLTSTDQILDTLRTLSPEAVKGQSHTAAPDLRSLRIKAYGLNSGRSPRHDFLLPAGRAHRVRATRSMA